MATTSFLTPTQRYAAGALFAFALHQAQIHQTHPLRLSSGEEESTEERTSSVSSADSVSDGPELWVHENSGLLPPVFRSISLLNFIFYIFILSDLSTLNISGAVQ